MSILFELRSSSCSDVNYFKARKRVICAVTGYIKSVMFRFSNTSFVVECFGTRRMIKFNYPAVSFE